MHPNASCLAFVLGTATERERVRETDTDSGHIVIAWPAASQKTLTNTGRAYYCALMAAKMAAARL